MDVSIIIVNWNSVQFLKDCIDSIKQHTAGITYEIIVIDSGSFDGCSQMLSSEFPEVMFIQSTVNIGFSGANNLAYSVSTGQHILFLNPDTELTSPAVNAMLDHLQHRPDAGAVGCKLLNRDGSVQTTCIQSFPTILNQLLCSEFLRERFPTSPLWGMSSLFCATQLPAQVDVISGACLMLRRSAFDQVGHFSDDYFMYAEDLDLCYKLKQTGYANYYVPQGVVRHFGGGCTDKAPSEFSVVMMRESIWRFLRKTRGAMYGSAYRVSTLISSVVRLILLMALCPLQRFWNRIPLQRGSFRKWAAILAWCLGIKSASHPL